MFELSKIESIDLIGVVCYSTNISDNFLTLVFLTT